VSRCQAGVPTSSSRGHSILYHCLTNSISQYTTWLGTDFIHSWFQSGGLFKTHTHHIAKSCFTASGHYWTFPSVFIAIDLFSTLDCFYVYCDCLLPGPTTARFGLLFCFALEITVCWCWTVPVWITYCLNKSLHLDLCCHALVRYKQLLPNKCTVRFLN